MISLNTFFRSVKLGTQANEWACVHGSDNKCLVLVRVEDIEGLNASQIEDKFNMSKVPTTLSRATIPKGTKMHIGQVRLSTLGVIFNSVQYEIIIPNGSNLPETWFTKIKDL